VSAVAIPDALFVPDGPGVYMPTEHTRGPWDPHAQHGGPPSALLAHCIERVEAPLPMEIARITVELMRPVPVERPLRVRTRVVRPGRKVQVVEAMLLAGDVEVCQAQALRIRREEVDLRTGGTEVVAQPPPPETGRLQPGVGGELAFGVSGVELRFVRGVFLELGPATVWIRLQHPVVLGEEPSGVERACAAADFGNGVSSIYEWGRTVFINPDLTVHLGRTPVGEWICLEAVTHPGTHGRAMAESRLFDRDGWVGHSLQSLLIEPL
jgi:hypothetical protein